MKNKGFTLVELIISFAILAVVSTIIVGFIISGSNAYSSVSADVSLQYESQLAMAQLQEYLIDCNGGVCFDSSSDMLYILNKTIKADGSVSYVAYVFRKMDNTLYFDSETLSVDSATGEINYSIGTSDDKSAYDLLSSNVSGFNVVFSTASTDASIATRANVTSTFSNRGKSYIGSQAVNFRNQVVVKGSFAALVSVVCAAP